MFNALSSLENIPSGHRILVLVHTKSLEPLSTPDPISIFPTPLSSLLTTPHSSLVDHLSLPYHTNWTRHRTSSIPWQSEIDRPAPSARRSIMVSQENLQSRTCDANPHPEEPHSDDESDSKVIVTRKGIFIKISSRCLRRKALTNM
jgi:hypothetical protein